MAAHCAATATDIATLLILFGNISDNNTQTTGPIDNAKEAINRSTPIKETIPTLSCCNEIPNNKKPVTIPIDPIYNNGFLPNLSTVNIATNVKIKFTNASKICCAKTSSLPKPKAFSKISAP